VNLVAILRGRETGAPRTRDRGHQRAGRASGPLVDPGAGVAGIGG